MRIIIRTCGERTTKKCIELAQAQGQVDIIKATPFTESIRQTYKLAISDTYKNQKWVPVIDADVLLYPDVIDRAIIELDKIEKPIFCLDGKTRDKIMMKNRRAGIHIYRRELIPQAMRYIDNSQLKPESHIRRMMTKVGFPTYTGKIIFGKHDYDQYYCDLWRKSVVQAQKLAKTIKKQKKLPMKWRKLGKSDKDYYVIYHGHLWGEKYRGQMTMDKNKSYDAQVNLKRLRIKEKGDL
jgi:hypothetical protein